MTLTHCADQAAARRGSGVSAARASSNQSQQAVRATPATSGEHVIVACVVFTLLGIDLRSWSAAEWAQVISAVSAALAALVALATVALLVRERRRSSWPDLHVEVIVDKPGDEVRLTVVNYGAPAPRGPPLGGSRRLRFRGFTEPSTFGSLASGEPFAFTCPRKRCQKSRRSLSRGATWRSATCSSRLRRCNLSLAALEGTEALFREGMESVSSPTPGVLPRRSTPRCALN
jgi:hypothetical protein